MGTGQILGKAFTASIGVTQGTAATLDIKAQNGAVQAAASWHGLLDNKVPGSIGLIISI